MPQNDVFHLVVPDELAGERIDVAVAKLAPETSRTRAQTIIRDGYLKLNGEICRLPRIRVEAGQVIDIDAPAQRITTQAKPESIPVDVMYEDEDVLVVNKPAGMVVHPAAGNWSGTLVNAILGREPELMDDEEMDPLRPGIVHRLDKDTSGALVIAKTPKALRKLSKAFARREVRKTYLAIVHGWPVPMSAVIKTGYARHPSDYRKMTVPARIGDGDGREAVTAYSVVKQGWYKGIKAALVKVQLHTGRTHQIRVHMSYKGYPLLGETLYNRGRAPLADRQMLHAWQLGFAHPETGEELMFEAPIPEDFQKAADAIMPEKE